MVRLDPDKKRLMDNFRVIARNVFYAALGPFKKAYNNYRDYHDQFRQLTQCSGYWKSQQSSVRAGSIRLRSNLDPFKLALVKTELEGRVGRRMNSRV
jgi:hypothetical protein